ncbi:ArsR family transcriptional regulator [Erysipelothrix rhusiopathiae]|uniref:ArsR family transcriptional regulator n=2 Tax=Erysipelothrix rhusiopathiae TaxID=1648 RepID=UPI0023B1D954|nr:ArsR family transcriptional regulator [Erysipelothrix rhusiopathiae]MDE8104736.1 ArsR family transcriptional regulator [Erysipelothrix rhusiopathiae]MDE8124865.1 ArsR family transcriptional regulator [Erysipelothrix rhusiopathiae]MDE8144020.1 ArsR family transcriptional regulator [Erysipelothrix rhusiopathiae]MDE8256151.1 ArsR family transcriptional regulator [Erysipelothrix rhusiopathiae]MDE8340655.1 ArsR family transcriptional regulator [Erysipelothrix rhusiopathiae]
MRDGKEGLKNKKKTGNQFSALHTSKSLTEIERLQLEILKRDIEIARLKKGYQVKGVGVNKAFVTLKDKNSK